MALVRFQDLAAASALTGTEIIPCTQGTGDVKTTSGAIAALATTGQLNPVTALSISSGVVNINCAIGDYFTLSLTANVTSITFSNLPASGYAKTIMIRMQQDVTGGRTMAFPSSFKAINGSDTTIQSAASAWTIFAATSFDQGTRWEYSMKAGAT